MKSLLRLGSLLLSFVVMCLSARAEIELAGIITDDQGILFSLMDGESGRRSGWLTIGQSFEGAKLDVYDVKSRRLILRQGDRRLELRLRESAPVESLSDALLRIERLEASGAITTDQADAARRAAGAMPINILGVVGVPGRTWSRGNGTLAEFIAAAGGMERTAHRSRVKVTRTDRDTGEKTMYQVDLSDREGEAEKRGGDFVLREGDVVFVPEVIF